MKFNFVSLSNDMTLYKNYKKNLTFLFIILKKLIAKRQQFFLLKLRFDFIVVYSIISTEDGLFKTS